VSLAVTGAALGGESVCLRASDGVIAELGPQVEPREGDEVLDAGGAAVVAGLVNGHTHAAMTLFRGFGDDLPLMRWLQEKIWPIEARLQPQDTYWGTRLACAEMIRTGTVRFWDMYWHPEAAGRAVLDAGLRATCAAPLIDGKDGAAAARTGALRSLEAVAELGEQVAPGLAPHAIYTVGEESLRWVAELAAERGVPVQIHLSETEAEVRECLQIHGERPAGYLERVGLLGPMTVLSHGVWLARSELELIAERGATVVTNPVANLKLAVGGVFPYLEARELGVAVGLGTDGPGSNNSLDLFDDMKTFALLQKHEAGDPAAVTAAEAWEIASGRRAPALGASGRLAPGEPADFLLLRRDLPELSLGELHAGLVYAASGSAVEVTVVAGRVLMRDGVVEGTEEIVARARECTQRLGIS
jgi:5-methylthioadenosine/S-adenosylhomocysteine deaminase